MPRSIQFVLCTSPLRFQVLYKKFSPPLYDATIDQRQAHETFRASLYNDARSGNKAPWEFAAEDYCKRFLPAVSQARPTPAPVIHTDATRNLPRSSPVKNKPTSLASKVINFIGFGRKPPPKPAPVITIEDDSPAPSIAKKQKTTTVENDDLAAQLFPSSEENSEPEYNENPTESDDDFIVGDFEEAERESIRHWTGMLAERIHSAHFQNEAPLPKDAEKLPASWDKPEYVIEAYKGYFKDKGMPNPADQLGVLDYAPPGSYRDTEKWDAYLERLEDEIERYDPKAAIREMRLAEKKEQHKTDSLDEDETESESDTDTDLDGFIVPDR